MQQTDRHAIASESLKLAQKYVIARLEVNKTLVESHLLTDTAN